MIIIKPGNEDVLKRGSCDVCGCEFKYLFDEVHTEERKCDVPFRQRVGHRPYKTKFVDYVICPFCKSKIYL